MSNLSPDNDEPDKESAQEYFPKDRFFARPSKSIGEMNEAEIRAFAKAFAAKLHRNDKGADLE
jgi:hypothetical protein